jgi:hypothetical protein
MLRARPNEPSWQAIWTFVNRALALTLILGMRRSSSAEAIIKDQGTVEVGKDADLGC